MSSGARQLWAVTSTSTGRQPCNPSSVRRGPASRPCSPLLSCTRPGRLPRPSHSHGRPFRRAASPTVARSLGKAMADDLGQPVVENKPVPTASSARRRGPQQAGRLHRGGGRRVQAASGVSLFKNLPYDPAVDLSPIGAVAETPYLLVGSPRPAGRQRPSASRLRRAASGQADLCLRLGAARRCSAPSGRGWVASTHVASIAARRRDRRDRRQHRGPDLHRPANGLQQRARAGKVKTYGVSTPERFRWRPTFHAERERRARLQPDRWPDGSEGSARAGIPAPGGRGEGAGQCRIEGSLRGAGPFRENPDARNSAPSCARSTSGPPSSGNRHRAAMKARVAACHPRPILFPEAIPCP